MYEHASRCRVSVEPSLLWLYLADYDNTMRLVAPDGSATLVDGEFGVVGACYRNSFQWEGLDSVSIMRLSAAECPSLLRWEWQPSHGTAIVEYRLSPDGDGGTEAEVHIALEFSPAIKSLEPFGWALFTRMHERGMRGLHGLTEDAVSRGIALREASVS